MKTWWQIMSTKTGRHLAREFSFKYLYHYQLPTFEEQRKLLSYSLSEAKLKQDIKNFEPAIETALDENNFSFAFHLIKGTILHYDEIEEMITKQSENWKLNRISKIDHTILLQAIFELKYMTDTPMKVVINESIELAKEFGLLESKNFVNGLLDAIAKNLNRE